MHMVLDGVEWKQAIFRHSQKVNIPYIHKVLSSYKKAGYTYLRDGGDRWGVGAMARALAPQYGITYRTPLAPLCKTGHYGAFIGRAYENMGEYAALVNENRREGGDFIKIMISGLMDFNRAGVLTEEGLDDGEIKELIHIAHEEGFSVMAHCNGARTMEAAAAAGVDSIEHGTYGDESAFAAMIENGTVWVPTVSTVANLRGTGRFPEKEVEAIVEHFYENIQRYAAMGGLLAVGSDAGAWAVYHGTGSEEVHLGKILGAEAENILQAGTAVIMKRF